MKMMTKDMIHEDFSVILELTDAEVCFIEEQPVRILDPAIMMNLTKSKGTNAHIITLKLVNRVNIVSYIDMLLGIYSSVSWVNPDGKFFIRRNLTSLFN